MNARRDPLTVSPYTKHDHQVAKSQGATASLKRSWSLVEIISGPYGETEIMRNTLTGEVQKNFYPV